MRLAAFAVLLCACFDPGPAPLLCSEAQPGCPDGLVCLGGMCKDSASSSDMQAMDMMIADLSVIPGCADGKGAPIGNKGCWTCPGTFSAPNAKTLCALTHQPALDSQLISDADCQAVLSGFFLSSVFGGTSALYSDPKIADCGFVTVKTEPAFFGCGVGGGNVNPSIACKGFRSNIQCLPDNGISCTGQKLDFAGNSKPNNGVLCCPK
jgi:hypothetical protein